MILVRSSGVVLPRIQVGFLQRDVVRIGPDVRPSVTTFRCLIMSDSEIWVQRQQECDGSVDGRHGDVRCTQSPDQRCQPAVRYGGSTYRVPNRTCPVAGRQEWLAVFFVALHCCHALTSRAVRLHSVDACQRPEPGARSPEPGAPGSFRAGATKERRMTTATRLCLPSLLRRGLHNLMSEGGISL